MFGYETLGKRTHHYPVYVLAILSDYLPTKEKENIIKVSSV